MTQNKLVSNCDDENDTFLFESLQEYVLKHYPNPERIGCLDTATLEAFVYAPETLALSDCKFLHVFKCAECTRVLMQHRQEKARRAKLDASEKKAGGDNPRGIYSKVLTAILLVLCCFALV